MILKGDMWEGAVLYLWTPQGRNQGEPHVPWPQGKPVAGSFITLSCDQRVFKVCEHMCVLRVKRVEGRQRLLQKIIRKRGCTYFVGIERKVQVLGPSMGKNSWAGREVKTTLGGWTQDQRDDPGTSLTVIWGEPMNSGSWIRWGVHHRSWEEASGNPGSPSAGSLFPDGRTWVQEIPGLPTSCTGPLEELWRYSFLTWGP